MPINKTLKLHEQADNKLRIEYENKLLEQYARREEQREKENINKKSEYRDYLLKQISDKENQKHEQIPNFTMKPFSEELIDPSEKVNLKLLKQREEKIGLDECVKMKNDLKLKFQQKEFEEDQKIAEFCKQRENETLVNKEKIKLVAEKKEHRNNEVALLWMAEKIRDTEREKFVDTLIEKEKVTDLDQEYNREILEMQKKISFKKELLKQIEEKVTISIKNLEDMKKEQEKIMAELVKEEELQKELIEKEKQKKLEYNRILQSSLLEKTKKQNKNTNYKQDKIGVLTDRNYHCSNSRFFGLE